MNILSREFKLCGKDLIKHFKRIFSFVLIKIYETAVAIVVQIMKKYFDWNNIKLNEEKKFSFVCYRCWRSHSTFYFAKNFPKLNEYKKFFFFKGDSKYLSKKKLNFNNNINFDLVICATSMNDYEKKVINYTKKIENWVILDNWTNYEKG